MITYEQAAHVPDALGRPPLRRISGLTCLRAFPWILNRFDKTVPDEMLAEDRTDDDRHAYIVPCPCGTEACVPMADIVECPGECGRFFLHAGSQIRVAKIAPEALAEAATEVAE